ncbi:MAG: AAA family ATPase [Proteobacteria bacterium]|nr:AAA family ATPase [Pseudomonadota bacterium]
MSTDAGWKYLEDRGVSRATAKRMGITVLDAAATEKETGFASPSIRIPYPQVNGKALDFVRYRLLDPSATPDGRKFFQKKGTGVHLYLGARPKGTTRDWDKIKADSRIPLVVTEGEIKANSAGERNLACIGIGGVDCWKTDGKPIKEWDAFELDGRVVDVTFDSDILSKPRVKAAAVELGEFLESRGALVRIRVLPDVTGEGKTGLDDFLVRRGPQSYLDTSIVASYDLDHEFIASWRKTSSMPVRIELSTVSKEWLMTPLPRAEFTVEGLLPRGTVGLLVAEGGAGKTHLALSLAMAVATGTPFLGRSVRRGSAVYLGLEDPLDVLRRRVEAAFSRYARAHPDKKDAYRAALLKHLYVTSLVGDQLHLVSPFHGGVVQNTATADHLGAKLREINDLELVILDPLARLHGGNENDNAVATAIINAAERVRGAANCTMLIPHHTGKVAASGKHEHQYSARGASALSDGARVVWRLVEATEKDAEGTNVDQTAIANRQVYRLVVAKSNYSGWQPPTWLRRTDGGSFEHFEPQFLPGGGPRYDEMLAKSASWIAAHGNQPVAPRTLRDQRAQVYGNNVTQKQVGEFIKAATERGDIREVRSAKHGTRLAIATKEDAQDAE